MTVHVLLWGRFLFFHVMKQELTSLTYYTITCYTAGSSFTCFQKTLLSDEEFRTSCTYHRKP